MILKLHQAPKLVLAPQVRISIDALDDERDWIFNGRALKVMEIQLGAHLAA
jgi:hypothetical protein